MVLWMNIEHKQHIGAQRRVPSSEVPYGHHANEIVVLQPLPDANCREGGEKQQHE